MKKINVTKRNSIYHSFLMIS